MEMKSLLSRVSQNPEPVFSGEWASLAFRPDLGSQQEFVVGVAIFIKGDDAPFLKWLPSFSKLSGLYGDAITTADIIDLTIGARASLLQSFAGELTSVNFGTPHMRIVPCGYISTNNVEQELLYLLRRHAGALWVEPMSREAPMDDDWAYSMMRQSISAIQQEIFLPHQRLTIASKTLRVGLDNGHSFGNIVSARFSAQATVERHVNAALRQIVIAHKLTQRVEPPALFVVLPEAQTSIERLITKKTGEILQEIEEMGIASFASSDPEGLARSLETWADA